MIHILYIIHIYISEKYLIQSENNALLDSIDAISMNIDQYQQRMTNLNEENMAKKVSEFALSEALRIKKENGKDVVLLIAELDRLRSQKKGNVD